MLELYNTYKKYPNICTDSRNIKKNSIFFALKGENFNGNKFAKEAIANGCKLAVIDDKEYHNKNTLLVENVLKCLQDLASFHRRKLNIPIIGVTGTNGKTTTKELIYNVLSQRYNTYYTKGNLNNQIGVPLSILEITESHEIAIIEMGASQINEIDNLCKIAQPTLGLITNIGIAHMEGFKDNEGVIKAKTELYNFIKENKGVVFVNSSDKLLKEKSNNITRITYGNHLNSQYKTSIIKKFPFISIEAEEKSISSNLVGDFQHDNISTACCIGNYFNIPIEKIKKGVESYIPKNNRTEIVKTKRNYIILDAYNANPSSMNSMIDSFSQYKSENKLCIIGDMLELAEYSKKEHNSIINKIQELGIPVIYIGKEFCKYTSENAFENISFFQKNIEQFELKDRTILIKGSRSLRLERLIEHL